MVKSKKENPISAIIRNKENSDLNRKMIFRYLIAFLRKGYVDQRIEKIKDEEERKELKVSFEKITKFFEANKDYLKALSHIMYWHRDILESKESWNEAKETLKELEVTGSILKKDFALWWKTAKVEEIQRTNYYFPPVQIADKLDYHYKNGGLDVSQLGKIYRHPKVSRIHPEFVMVQETPTRDNPNPDSVSKVKGNYILSEEQIDELPLIRPKKALYKDLVKLSEERKEKAPAREPRARRSELDLSHVEGLADFLKDILTKEDIQILLESLS